MICSIHSVYSLCLKGVEVFIQLDVSDRGGRIGITSQEKYIDCNLPLI